MDMSTDKENYQETYTLVDICQLCPVPEWFSDLRETQDKYKDPHTDMKTKEK